MTVDDTLPSTTAAKEENARLEAPACVEENEPAIELLIRI
jgi:hypothetical protein